MQLFGRICIIFLISSCSVGDDLLDPCYFCGGAGGESSEETTSSGSNTSKNSSSITTTSNNSSHSSSQTTNSTNACQAKTCLDIAISLNNNQTQMWDGSTPKACGVFDDGCGSFIECTENSDDPTGDEQCGPGKWCGAGRVLDGGIPTAGVPGLCDGNCVFQGVCENGARQQYICSGESEESPVFLYTPVFDNCDPVAMSNKSTQWCCAPSI